MERELPLSEKARMDQMLLWFGLPDYQGGSTGIVWRFFLWAICLPPVGVIVLYILFSSALLSVKLGVVFGVFVPFAIVAYWFIRSFREKSVAIRARNKEDFELSLSVQEAHLDLVRRNTDLTEVKHGTLEAVTGLVPVRVDFFPESEIAGEFGGSFRGNWGLFSLGGVLSGRTRADSSPELYNQNAVIIAVDSSGETFRLVCPSILMIRRNLRNYFQAVADEYGRNSHSYNALRAFWDNGLRSLLEKPNPQRLYDRTITSLEKPKDGRVRINVKGIQIRPGAFLASVVSLNDETGELVTPIDLMAEVKQLLETRLPRALPAPKLGIES